MGRPNRHGTKFRWSWVPYISLMDNEYIDIEISYNLTTTSYLCSLLTFSSSWFGTWTRLADRTSLSWFRTPLFTLNFNYQIGHSSWHYSWICSQSKNRPSHWIKKFRSMTLWIMHFSTKNTSSLKNCLNLLETTPSSEWPFNQFGIERPQ